MILDKLGLWPARLIWILAPLVIGNGLVKSLDGRASGPSLLVEVLLWLAWFGVLVALLAPSPRSLTATRIAGPAAVGIGVIALVATGWSAVGLLALGYAALFCGLVFLPVFSDLMINGSAYGSERRMALRPPAVVLLGPAQIAWLLVFAGLVIAPLLVLAERYVLAVIAAVLGVAAIWAGSRVLHQLSRRWIVFVPAGFVIHDPVQIIDSVLMRRNEIKALGPAFAEGDDASSSRSGDRNENRNGNGSGNGGAGEHRRDISGGALGLALEVELKSPTPVTLRQDGELINVELSNIVFSPTLPGAMLAEARIRGVKIGEASAPV